MISTVAKQMLIPVRYLWAYKLTACGKAIIIAAAAMTLFVDTSAGVQVLTVLLSLTALAFFVPLLLRGRLDFDAGNPPRAVADGAAELSYRLRNKSRKPAFDVSIHCGALPESIDQEGAESCLAQLPGRKTERISKMLHCSRRGRFVLPGAKCITTFPFGLFRTMLAQADETELVVYPRFGSVRNLELDSMEQREREGRSPAKANQRSDEYIGNRPYQAGDAMRDVDVRAWARLGRPAVKEFNDRQFHRFGIFIDTSPVVDQLLDMGQRRRFEAGVSLAASLSNTLIGQGHHMDVLADGRRMLLPGGGAATLGDVLERLAVVEPDGQALCQGHGKRLLDSFGTLSAVCLVVFGLNDELVNLAQAAARISGRALVFLIVADGDECGPNRPAGSLGVYNVTVDEAMAAEVVL